MHQELLAHLKYQPETGHWIRLQRAGSGLAGSRADSLTKGSKYFQVRVFGKQFNAHRLAWFYMTGNWPTWQIDHVDGLRHNNKWSNLREATQQQNQGNQKKHRDNTGGFKGVRKSGRKWVASIGKNYQNIYLGTFNTAEEAAAAYKKAAQVQYGVFARAG